MAVARSTLRSQLSLMQSLTDGHIVGMPFDQHFHLGLAFTTVATLASTSLARGLMSVLPLVKTILSLSEMKTTLFSTFTTTSVSLRLPRELFRLTTSARVTESFFVNASCRLRMRRSCLLDLLERLLQVGGLLLGEGGHLPHVVQQGYEVRSRAS
jgi:hypothetical protein